MRFASLSLFSAFCVNIALCASISMTAQAEMHRLEAPVDVAKWEARSSRLQCSLTHTIPGFGQARFVSYHGHDINLQFDLRTQYRLPLKPGDVVVRSLAPSWLPGVEADELGSVAAGHDRALVQVKQDQAWRLLTELEQGRSPTFYYEGYASGADSVAIGLSSVRFPAAMDKFQQCLGLLLPYTFADIANSVMYFEFDKTDFTPATKARLNQIRDYLSVDKDIDLMLIEGYTDTKGGRWLNQQLGQKRADAVRNYLLKSGIDEKRVKSVSYGERKPVNDNKSEAARAKNRRVVVNISR